MGTARPPVVDDGTEIVALVLLLAYLAAVVMT